MQDYLFLIPIAPLIGFFINGLLGKRLGDNFVFMVGCSVILVSFIISVLSLFEIIKTGTPLVFSSGSWFTSGTLDVSITLKVDQLSAIMINIVSGVGFLIHVYSTGYMKGDEGIYKFFAYINLFCFAMLVLVMGDNLLLLFLGWEGVGLCSYLLIGFWYKNNEYADAGKKAFIVNRIGDFGFLLGIFLIFINFGTLEFSQLAVSPILSTINVDMVTIITLLLFVGAMGKSAQIPLYVWLPDAMAGPTPVSALIHAATMVTAGVYMIGRLHFLFSLSEVTMLVILIVGGVTALFSGTIGVTQNDIKKVLAYSTVSQLGYMFMAMAVGAFSTGIFHLMTHAFFKACLFLSAGSVIVACHHEQDMLKMGGLAKKIPVTYWAFLIGSLALAGVMPFMSGFLSKDLLLEKVFFSGMRTSTGVPVGHIFWGVGVLTAMFTAFYTFRLMGMTFWAKTNMTDEEYSHVHEPPVTMTSVLVILAILSVIGGWIGIPAVLGGANHFDKFLSHVFGGHEEHASHGSLPYILMAVSTTLGIALAVVAGLMYGRKSAFPDRFVQGGIGKVLHKLSFNKYFVDEIYEALIVVPIMKGSHYLWKFFDVLIIDGIVNGAASVAQFLANFARNLNTGNVNSYALSILVGVIALLVYVLKVI